MKRNRRMIVVMLTLFACLVFVPVASAHPLGNFTVNQYAGLHVSREVVVVDYVMDLAEIPAFQEIELLDTNGNRQPDAAEAAAYHSVRCASLQPSLNVFLNKKAVALSLISSSVEFPAGVGGLPTMRLTCEFQAPIEVAGGALALSFENHVFADRLGWQEIVVIPDGVSLKGDYSATSLSRRLMDYPQNLLTSPPEQRTVDVEISWVGMPAQSQPSAPIQQGSLSSRDDMFTRLILVEKISLSTLLIAIGISFLWGAAHALTPGHGKTIVGAYLVGSRGTPKHALYLGLTTTITHTLGVFALGLITLFAAQYIVPEMLYPWLSLLSGLFIFGLGVSLFMRRFRSSGINVSRVRAGVVKRPREMSPQKGGLGITAVFQHNHSQHYVMNASSEHLHVHDHGHLHVHKHPEHDHDHTHDSHREGGHSHMPPEQITWRSLLALGISGGLVPCPSALVVLLGAIALNRIGFGLILVLAFSLGLAGALTAIGMLFLYAGRAFERFPAQRRIVTLLPVISSLFVSILGTAIVWKALVDLAA